MKYISLPLFIFSFLIGMLYLYMSSPPTRNILIYPTVDNNSKFQYIDKAENCLHLRHLNLIVIVWLNLNI